MTLKLAKIPMIKAYFRLRIIFANKLMPIMVPISDKDDNVRARILIS